MDKSHESVHDHLILNTRLLEMGGAIKGPGRVPAPRRKPVSVSSRKKLFPPSQEISSSSAKRWQSQPIKQKWVDMGQKQ
jgi:hypothetical protein